MKHVWRWFGPKDNVAIEDIEQAGATGVVTALHHISAGEIWTADEIAKRQAVIAQRSDGTPSNLQWDVVESLPVSEHIKAQSGDWRTHIANYKTSLENLAKAGIQVICYNFMPVLDWTRTDLTWGLPNSGSALRFDLTDMAVFDCFLLNRPGAEQSFAAEIVEAARERHASMSVADKAGLVDNIVKGLPGEHGASTLEDIRAVLATYGNIDEAQLRRNLADFISEVVPVAEKLGLRLCCHPDDPPFSLLGLPRIMSTEADYAALVSIVDSPANGITLCSGSLGVHPGNDLPGMMRRLGHKVAFLHMRNTLREGTSFPVSFHESEHLGGDTNMVDLISAVLDEEGRRKSEGRADWRIPMRPDHGHAYRIDAGLAGQPGYPYGGRMRGLAELRGIETALRAAQ